MERFQAKSTLSPYPAPYPAWKLTLRSLRRIINQFKEEIARFDVRMGAAAAGE